MSYFLFPLLLTLGIETSLSKALRERETEGERGSTRLQAQIGKVKLVTYQVIEGLRPCTQNPRYCTIHNFIPKDALLEMAMNRNFLYQ